MSEGPIHTKAAQDAINGEPKCQTAMLGKKLRDAGLRPTRQRLALAQLLFCDADRHVSAEALHAEAKSVGFGISLATVYNTLHQFCDVGLIRAIALEANKTYFDTNTGDHHHFFLESNEKIYDVPKDVIKIENLPEPPEGMEISRVDVVIRLKNKSNS